MKKNRLYVGNLSFDSYEDDIRELFSQAGSVEDIALIPHKFRRHHRGFAFVTMASDEEAEKAIELFNGNEFMGRELQVNVAQPKEERR